MRIGDRIYVHGYVDEIRKDCVIVRNEGGYFGTIESEIKLVKHGKWMTPRGHENARCCSECKCIYHKDSVSFYAYCPNCGAEMERKEE